MRCNETNFNLVVVNTIMINENAVQPAIKQIFSIP
jgi:hypothetical protein